jgi:glycosyltransferase involved in cell wall biosynthesis
LLYLIKKISKKVKEHDVINAHNHPAQWISKFTKVPTIWMCNEPPLYYNIPRDIRRLKYSFQNSLDKYLSSNIALILALDTRMEEIIREKYSNKRVEIINSGVDLNRKIKHNNNNYFDVLFVGPIHPQKRPLDIIEAFSLVKKKLSNLRLHFVGDVILPKIKKEMVFLSQKNNLEIIFYNSVSDEKLYELYDIADMSVFVPEAQPWGIFPLESILAGIPTIISDQTGIKDILPNNFPIVETGNIKKLAKKVLEVIENYGECRKKTIEISKIISEKYSWEAYSKRMINIFNEMVEGK